MLFLVIFSLDCSETGYREYLKSYSWKYGDSLDTYVKYEYNLSINIRNHYKAYKANCKVYEFKNKRSTGNKPDITVFMDWSDEEMEQLQNLSVRYSGVTTLYDDLCINENQYSLS